MEIIAHNVSGVIVEHRSSDDYINATALVKAYQQATGNRRDVSEWLSNKRTQESFNHLSAKTGIPVIQLCQAFRGSPENGGGTWLHPRLAVRFAMWLSDDFGYMVEEWFVKQVENSSQLSPVTPLEALAAIVQQMVEQERKIRQQEVQLNELLAIQQEAREELASLPYADRPAPEKSDRSKVNELVRNYVRRNNTSYPEVWGKLYREFRYRCHIDAELRSKNQNKKPLDVIEELGLMNEMHAIASEILS